MRESRKNILLILAATLIASQALAQDAPNTATAYAEREVSEIVVYGSREVDRAFTDPVYEKVWREQLLEQIALMRLEEANEWRASLTYELRNAPSIVLGFDPKYDLERRQYLDLVSEQRDTIKTATLARAGFNWP